MVDMITKEQREAVLNLLQKASPNGLDIDLDSCEVNHGIPGNTMDIILEEFEGMGLIRLAAAKGSTYVFPKSALYEYVID